ncbi:MAG: hypothetical protein LBT74_12130 [Acidobacteriota bacterium]|jgi:YbbR domain-containing protein|nr:hypothetical protein [Acidobacteriota bacterium]
MKRFLRKLFLDNWLLKATSLLLAIVLWLFVHGGAQPERVVAVPLEVRVPRQMEIVSNRPPNVEVTLRGAMVSGSWLNQPLTSCVVDLQNAPEGEHIITLTQSNIKMSQGAGVEILQINPAHLTIILEPTVSKEVPIGTPVEDGPPSGYELYSKYPRPASVIITGARSRIAPISEVETMPLSLAEQREPGRFFVNLNLPDPSIRTSVSAENPVQVQVNVGRTRRLHTVEDIPVTVDGDGYVASPKQIAVQILAPPEFLDRATVANFRATVRSGAFDAAKLPAKAKPLVQILNDTSGAAVIKAIQPPEIQIQKKR